MERVRTSILDIREQRSTLVLATVLASLLVASISTAALAITPESASPPPDVLPTAQTVSDAKEKSRVDDGLKKKMAGLGSTDVLRVIVTMEKGKGVAAAQAAVGSFGVVRRFTIINGFTATMTRSQIEALSRAPGVVSIHEDLEVKAYRADAMQSHGVAQVHTNPLGERLKTYDGSGVGVCIVDTGIMATHPEFAGGKVKGFCDATAGQCGAGGATTYTPFDDHGHGTHVASIAAGVNGIAPGASLWGAKVLKANGSGTSTDIIAGIEWCAAQSEVHVLNLSLGSTGSADGTDPMGTAANVAAASKVVVLAAGNSGPAQLQISTPAAAEKPITVGAVGDLRRPGGPWRRGLAVFSSRGPTSDARIKPDILAPGVDINAAWNDGGLRNASGTSMATPYVAGVAALMLDANMALITAPTHPDGVSAGVKAILAQTAVTRGDASTLVDGYPKNYDYGWGEIDAYAAVAVAEGAASYTPTALPQELYQNPTIADGTVWEYEFEVTDPHTPISAVVTNGGVWTALYFGGNWYTLEMGQDFDAQLHAPAGTPGGTLVDESTCAVDSDTQCGSTGRQETLVAEPSDFGGSLPLGTWRVRVEPWSDTDGKPQEIIDLTILMGPLGNDPAPSPNAPPTAGFSFGTSGLTATFTDGSSDSDGTVTSWSWSFGDGNGSTATNPSHTYGAAGTYTVTLTVTDDDGASDSTSQSVTVDAPNDPPIAGFSYGTSGLTATFTDGSSDSDGTVTSWSWSFGDGNSSTDTNPWHPYSAAGTYTVTLTVTDNDGASDSVSQNVTVTDPSVGVPAAPTIVGATDRQDGTAEITWTDTNANEDGFEIQREKQHRNGKWVGTTIAGNTAADTTSFVDASGEGTFHWRVRAFNSAGASNWSGWATTTVTNTSGGGGGGGGETINCNKMSNRDLSECQTQ